MKGKKLYFYRRKKKKELGRKIVFFFFFFFSFIEIIFLDSRRIARELSELRMHEGKKERERERLSRVVHSRQ